MWPIIERFYGSTIKESASEPLPPVVPVPETLSPRFLIAPRNLSCHGRSRQESLASALIDLRPQKINQQYYIRIYLKSDGIAFTSRTSESDLQQKQHCLQIAEQIKHLSLRDFLELYKIKFALTSWYLPPITPKQPNKTSSTGTQNGTRINLITNLIAKLPKLPQPTQKASNHEW